jgi:hypothetical protein
LDDALPYAATAGAFNPDRLKSGVLQMRDIVLLVHRAALAQDFQKRVPDPRLFQAAVRGRYIEICQVPAAQVADKVGRTQLKSAVNSLHEFK